MQRNSSVELLRILSVFMIMSYHYSLKAGINFFNFWQVGKGTIFLQCMGMFGCLACSIFVLITGFYSIEKEDSLKAVSLKNSRLFFKMVIYSLILFFVNESFGFVQLTRVEKLNVVIPFLKENWFITYFILFMYFTPFLNSYLNSITVKQYRNLCFLSLIIYSVLPTLTIGSIKFSNFDFFLFFYIWGGYIQKSDLYNSYSYKFWLFISVVLILLFFTSVITLDCIGIYKQNNYLVNKATWLRNPFTVPSVMLAVTLFCTSLNFVFYNSFINILASTALGVYLLHDNLIMRKIIWETIYPNRLYIEYPYFNMFAKIIIIYMVCVFCDLLFSKIFGRTFSFLANKTNLLFEQMLIKLLR